MKRFIVILLLALFSLCLVSCDYPEKSFQALQIDRIPTEVTRDFTLERGVYAPFIWTSDNDALVIEEQSVTVNQKEVDVLVNITATINKRSETFVIKVLKIGSDLSSREKAEDITIYLNETYTKIDGGILELPNKMNGIYIKYNLDIFQSDYGYRADDDNTYLSSSYRACGNSISIMLTFYDHPEMNYDSIVYHDYLSLITESLEADDKYIHAIEEININNYSFIGNLKHQMVIKNIKVGDVINFGSSEVFDCELIMNNSEYFEKIDTNKYEIIKVFRDRTSELGRLIITIDNMPKTMFIQMYM